MRSAHAIFFTVSLSLMGASLAAQPAEARRYDDHGARSYGHRAAFSYGHRSSHHATRGYRSAHSYGHRVASSQRQHRVANYRSHRASGYGRYLAGGSGLGGRPARWCGWWMRTQKGGGPEMNLARNWANWGRPSGPQVGAVVVWSHHVGIITGRTASGWVVKSGNDGGRVRERVRSVAGAVFRVG
jgi:hypothetical protein